MRIPDGKSMEAWKVPSSWEAYTKIIGQKDLDNIKRAKSSRKDAKTEVTFRGIELGKDVKSKVRYLGKFWIASFL